MEYVIYVVKDRFARLPLYATSGSAGADVHANNAKDIAITPGTVAKIPTGLKFQIPTGTALLITPRSGLASKGITVANSPGILDSDYRGELHVLLQNNSDDVFVVHYEDRIAQLMLVPYLGMRFAPVDEFEPEENNLRGTGGFGSTGGHSIL